MKQKKPRPLRKHLAVRPKKGRSIVARVHISRDTDEKLKYLWGHFRLSLDDIIDEAAREKYNQIKENQEIKKLGD
ncbi:MAG: hypothetical protein GY943_03810 [Chloroflexi bacterium]|nr:hypothetical protein [Chloroflexota bacterium]